jgi:chromosome segregation ATPase
MTDNIENLVLEHLKRFQASQDRIERKLDEHTQRLGRIEITLARLASAQGQHEEVFAEQSVRIDRLSERLDRIERRLELRE